MRSKLRIFAALCVMPILAASLACVAQVTPASDEAQKAPAKKADAAAKKVEAPKAQAAAKTKYVPEKKPLASKAAAKPAKAPAPAASPNVTVLRSGQRSPVILRDKEGNIIPTSPDAYDVSSATGKK